MKRLLITAVMISAVVLCRYAWAAEPLDKVQRILEEVMAIQTAPRLKGTESRVIRKNAIKKVIAANFDLDAMAEEALGSYWQVLNGYQQKEFQRVFQDLFQDSYTRLVLDFLGRENVQYNREEVEQDHGLVKTTILRPNEEIAVDYSLVRNGREWLIGDVAIDSVSIVENYRRSFSRVIKRQSYDMLIQRMRLQQQSIQRSS